MLSFFRQDATNGVDKDSEEDNINPFASLPDSKLRPYTTPPKFTGNVTHSRVCALRIKGGIAFWFTNDTNVSRNPTVSSVVRDHAFRRSNFGIENFIMDPHTFRLPVFDNNCNATEQYQMYSFGSEEEWYEHRLFFIPFPDPNKLQFKQMIHVLEKIVVYAKKFMMKNDVIKIDTSFITKHWHETRFFSEVFAKKQAEEKIELEFNGLFHEHNWGVKNKTILELFFPLHSMSYQFAKRIGAPMEYIDPADDKIPAEIRPFM